MKDALFTTRDIGDSNARQTDIHDIPILVRQKIGRQKKEAAASEMLAMSMIFDAELGIVYDAVYADVAKLFVITKHYTNINTDAFDTPEGWYALYDIVYDYGNILYDYIPPTEMDDLYGIYKQLRASTKRIFEREHSLDRAILRMLGGAIAQEDQTETLAEARSAAELLIDALGALHSQRMTNIKGMPLSFAKKNNIEGRGK